MSDYDIYKEVRFLRDKVQAIDHKQEVLIRAQRAAIEAEVLDAMRKDPKLARVYLAIDGSCSQKEIVERVVAAGTPMSEPTVCRKIDVLKGELAVIELIDRNSRGKIYVKSAVDKILQLTPRVKKLIQEIDK